MAKKGKRKKHIKKSVEEIANKQNIKTDIDAEPLEQPSPKATEATVSTKETEETKPTAKIDQRIEQMSQAIEQEKLSRSQNTIEEDDIPPKSRSAFPWVEFFMGLAIGLALLAVMAVFQISFAMTMDKRVTELEKPVNFIANSDASTLLLVQQRISLLQSELGAIRESIDTSKTSTVDPQLGKRIKKLEEDAGNIKIAQETSNQELKDQLKKLKEAIAQQKGTPVQADSKLAQKVKTLLQTVEDLGKQMQTAKEDHNKINTDIQALQDQIKSTDQIKPIAARIDDLQIKLENLQKKSTESPQGLLDLAQKLEQLETKHNNLPIQGLEKQITALRDAIVNSSGSQVSNVVVESLRQEIKNLEQKYKELPIKQLQENIADLKQKAIKLVQKGQEAIQSQIKDLADKHAALPIKDIQTQVSDLRNETRSTNQTLQNQVKTQLAELKADNQTLQTQVKALEEKFPTQLAELKAGNQTLQTQVKALEEKLPTQFSTLQKETTTLQAQIKTIAEQQTAQEQLQQKLTTDQQTNIKNLHQQIQDKSAAIEKIQTQITDLKKQLNGQENNGAEATSTLKERIKQLEIMHTTSLKELQMQVGRLVANVGNIHLSREFTKLKTMANAHHEQLEAITKTIAGGSMEPNGKVALNNLTSDLQRTIKGKVNVSYPNLHLQLGRLDVPFEGRTRTVEYKFQFDTPFVEPPIVMANIQNDPMVSVAVRNITKTSCELEIYTSRISRSPGMYYVSWIAIGSK